MKYALSLVPIAFMGLGTKGQSNFLPPISIGPNIARVQKAVLTDVENDGILEIVLGSTGASKGETIALGLANGQVSSFTRLIQDDEQSDVTLIADLNMDGYQDIIRSGLDHHSLGDPSSLFVHWGNSEGIYGEPTVTNEGYDCYPRLIADITGDGIPELISDGGGGIEIYHYVASENAMRLYRSLDLNGSGFYCSVADLDTDGILDLVFAPRNSYSGQIRAWFGSDGADSPTVLISTFTGWIGEMGAADFDQDGRTDLFAGSSSGTNSAFDVWLNQGEGLFEHHEELYMGSHFGNYELMDIDDDNVVDLVYVNHQRILRTRILPDLSVSDPDTLCVMTKPILSFSIDDVDGDGTVDLMTIGNDTRLSLAKGTADPLVFQTPVGLFKWHRNHVSGMAVYKADSLTQPQLAFVSTDLEFEVDLLDLGRNDSIPVIGDVQLGNIAWSYENGAVLLAEDLDGDGDEDLVGCQSSYDIFNSCQLFAVEVEEDELTEHCLGSSLANIQLYSALQYVDVDLFDVTGDGLSDLIFSGAWEVMGNEETWGSATQVLESTSPFTVQPVSTTYPAASYFSHWDVDHDGDEDLLENNTSGNEILVRYNNGSGQFPTMGEWPWDFASRGGLRGLVDIDGDMNYEAWWMRVDDGILRCFGQTVSPHMIGTQRTLFERPYPEEFATIEFIDMDGDMDTDVLFKYRRTDGTYDWVLEYHENLGSVMGDDGELIYVDRWFNHLPLDADLDTDIDLVINRTSRLHLLRNTSLSTNVPKPQTSSSGTFKLFPNPANDERVSLDLGFEPIGDVTIEIMDATGRIVRLRTQNTRLSEISISGLANGQYLLRAFDQNSGQAIGTSRLVTF